MYSRKSGVKRTKYTKSHDVGMKEVGEGCNKTNETINFSFQETLDEKIFDRELLLLPITL